jgi:hypothetical protein
MRRLFSSLVLAATLASVLVAPALAVKPDREPLELPPVIEMGAGDVCPFAVTVEFLANNGKTMTFYDQAGEAVRSIGTGTLKIRATNTSDPDQPSVTLNISGPIHTVFHADGSSTLYFGGRSISLYPAGTFVLTAGRAVIRLDAAGNFVSGTNSGMSEDVCGMIAD